MTQPTAVTAAPTATGQTRPGRPASHRTMSIHWVTGPANSPNGKAEYDIETNSDADIDAALVLLGLGLDYREFAITERPPVALDVSA